MSRSDGKSGGNGGDGGRCQSGGGGGQAVAETKLNAAGSQRLSILWAHNSIQTYLVPNN
jgi:hypothetical protein